MKTPARPSKKAAKGAPAERRPKGRPHADGPKVGREAVVAVTRRMLKEMSPSKMSRNEVAREAGIDPALIRYYFGDQNTLLTEVLLQITDEAHRRRELARRGQEAAGVTTQQKISARIDRLREMLTDNPHVHELVLDRVVYGKGATEEQIALLRDRWHRASLEELQGIIDEGVENGELRSVDARYLYIAMAGMNEFAVNAFPLFELLGCEPRDQETTLKDYAKFLVDLVLNGISAKPDR